MAGTPEGKVKAAIKRWLQDRGIWYFMPVSSGMGMHGIPDFVCVWNGRALFIEAKAPGKRHNTSEMQKHRIEEIRSAGGIAVVVDDVSQLNELVNAHPELV